MSRREARERAFLFLFGNIFTKYGFGEIVQYCSEEATDTKTDKFTIELYKGVEENIEKIDEIIDKTSVKWSKDRLSKVALTILRISLFEILFRDDVPVSVSINEAVELAKKYGTEDEASFINGVLGTVSKSVEKKDE